MKKLQKNQKSTTKKKEEKFMENSYLLVLFRGKDNKIWQRSWNGMGWNNWDCINEIPASIQSMLTEQPGSMDVFYRGFNDELVHKRYEDNCIVNG